MAERGRVDDVIEEALREARSALGEPAQVERDWRALQGRLAHPEPGGDGAGGGESATGGAGTGVLGATKAVLGLTSLVVLVGVGAWLWPRPQPPANGAPAPPPAATAPLAPTSMPAGAITPPPTPSPEPARAMPHGGGEPAPAAEAAKGTEDEAAPGSRGRPRRPRPRAAPSAEATAEAATVDPGAEIALIERARRALELDPAQALVPLGAHARQFPRGVLAQERELMRIEALRALGRMAEARAGARAFRQAHPGSPHSRRLRDLLGTHESTSRRKNGSPPLPTEGVENGPRR